MSRILKKKSSVKLRLRAKRHARIRKKVSGTQERPRLCVTRSNRGIVVQLIDDDKGLTLLSSRTPANKTANLEASKELGKSVAAQAKAKGIEAVVFDRGGYIYHGKIAALADGAREGGLKL